MAGPTPDAVRDEIVRLARVGLSRYELARATMSVLRRAVPFDGVAAVWFDPATGLAVDTWVGDSLAEIDLDEAEADIDAFRALAASGRRAATMGETSDGSGGRHEDGVAELRAVCVGESGMWGAILLRRERGAPRFTAREPVVSADWPRICC